MCMSYFYSRARGRRKIAIAIRMASRPGVYNPGIKPAIPERLPPFPLRRSLHDLAKNARTIYYYMAPRYSRTKSIDHSTTDASNPNNNPTAGLNP